MRRRMVSIISRGRTVDDFPHAGVTGGNEDILRSEHVLRGAQLDVVNRRRGPAHRPEVKDTGYAGERQERQKVALARSPACLRLAQEIPPRFPNAFRREYKNTDIAEASWITPGPFAAFADFPEMIALKAVLYVRILHLHDWHDAAGP